MKIHVDDVGSYRYRVYLDGKEVVATYADDENGIVLVYDEETMELVKESVTDGTGFIVGGESCELAKKLERPYLKALKGNVVIEEIEKDTLL